MTSFHPHLLQTLSKWSSKIQAVAPSVLLPSNRGAFSKGGQNLKSAVQLVEETLHDQNKLLTRTQILRVKKVRIGAALVDRVDDAEVVDVDVFDDTDFYQKILRDIIDARGDGSKNDDWMLLQKQKKAKKKVDTKASKGRKLRYVRPISFAALTHCSTCNIATRSMKNCKTLWYQCQLLASGTKSKSTSYSRRFWARDSKILHSTRRRRKCRAIYNLEDLESLDKIYIVHFQFILWGYDTRLHVFWRSSKLLKWVCRLGGKAQPLKWNKAKYTASN